MWVAQSGSTQRGTSSLGSYVSARTPPWIRELLSVRVAQRERALATRTPPAPSRSVGRPWRGRPASSCNNMLHHATTCFIMQQHHATTSCNNMLHHATTSCNNMLHHATTRACDVGKAAAFAQGTRRRKGRGRRRGKRAREELKELDSRDFLASLDVEMEEGEGLISVLDKQGMNADAKS